MARRGATAFEDLKVPVKLKISALWAAIIFCYIYADYFALYLPGKLAQMNGGQIAPLGAATPLVLLGVSVMMAIPSVMVFLSVILPAPINRWANMAVGTIYTLIIVLTMIGAPLFYLFYGTIEVVLTLLIVRYGWTWPRAKPPSNASSAGAA